MVVFHKEFGPIKKILGFFCGMEGKERRKVLKSYLKKTFHVPVIEELTQSSLIFFSSNIETSFHSRFCTFLLLI